MLVSPHPVRSLSLEYVFVFSFATESPEIATLAHQRPPFEAECAAVWSRVRRGCMQLCVGLLWGLATA